MRLPHSAATGVGVLIRHPNSAATGVGVSYGTRIQLRQTSEYSYGTRILLRQASEYSYGTRILLRQASEYHTAPEFRCDRRWSTDTGGLFFAQCFRGLHVAELTSRDVDAQTHHDN